MCREPVETEVCLQLLPVLRRHLAERAIVGFVGSDNFIYWVKGNIKACVSPDIYILPGIAQTTRPAQYDGTKDEQCWKTWIHQVVPNFALEVKARRNPRKDELQSPPRHDALGTKELIVFDPFFHRRRAHRKRFVVYRRNANGKLVIVQEINDVRVYSEALDAYLVAENEGDHSLLRLGLGPNGEQFVPFESELVEIKTQRANEAAQRADEAAQRANEAVERAKYATRLRQEESQRADDEARLRQEESRRADEETRLRQEESRRADEATRLRQEESRRADEAIRRAKELEAELERLRADAGKRRKR
jgi:hypothetical protein